MKNLPTLLAASLVLSTICGCSTRSGPIKEPPGADSSANSAKVTVYRESALVGSPANMIFLVDGQEVYGLRQGERHSFRLAPGHYGFGYYLGMNECRRAVHIQAKGDYLFKLAPNCVIEQEQGPGTP